MVLTWEDDPGVSSTAEADGIHELTPEFFQEFVRSATINKEHAEADRKAGLRS
jgi:hypothetical protein